MKILLYIFSSLVLASTFMFSCTVEISNNGKLDGFWHLNAIESRSTGHKADYSDSLYYWAFQADLLSTRKVELNGPQVFWRFNHFGDSLTIKMPFGFIDQGKDSAIVQVNQVMQIMGINKLEEHYKVIELTSKKMKLEGDKLCLSFNKL